MRSCWTAARARWAGIAGVAVVALMALACSGEDAPLKSVTFMAGFKPQANLPFAAAYVAQEKGYFHEQGLDVDIRHSTGEHLNLLIAGDVHFTTADANSVLQRRADPGLPIVAIALFGQRGQQAFVALEESGIQTPKDWEGRTFGYKVSVPPDYLAIVDAAGVDRSRGAGSKGWVRSTRADREARGHSGRLQVERAQHHPRAGVRGRPVRRGGLRGSGISG